MHSTSETERARLMAQWVATGGGLAISAGMPAGDDGLKAAISRPVVCGDDGLKASFSNMRGASCGDDGLAAVRPTGSPAFHCAAGDEMKAFNPTAQAGSCLTDDGLTASGPSFRGCPLFGPAA